MHNKNAFKKGVIGDSMTEAVLDGVNISTFEPDRNGTENVERCYNSMYDDSEEDGFFIPNTSDEDNIDPVRKKRKKNLVYNPKCNHSTFNFAVGMKFENVHQFRECITKYAIINGYKIKWTRINTIRMEAKYQGTCSWNIYVAIPKGKKTVKVRRHYRNHCCFRTLSNRLANSDWLAKKFLSRLRENPDYIAIEMITDVQKKVCFNCW